ncbi:MAG TPA: methylenetetrahydrofolate reductase [Bacteroidales bacterium]|nr:methylenetetrahydrofolate reductase [Bacteroidales bacterium]
MSKSKYKSGSRLEQVLTSGQFALTGELGPPKAVEAERVRQKAGYLKGTVDAVNITDNQTAIVRMSSFSASMIALSEGVEPVMQITTRDRNRLAIQSDVIGAAALGIKNILCLSGDHHSFGNHPQAKSVYDIDSIQLIHMLKAMRDEGVFASGEPIRSTKKSEPAPPQIFIGAAANPFAEPVDFRVMRLAKKIKAGADFIQTQVIYDMNRFHHWMQEVCEQGLHEKAWIMAGITPLKSARMASYMKEHVSGISIPDEIIHRLSSAEDQKAEGMQIAVEQMQELKEVAGVSGVHLMAIGAEKHVPDIAEAAGFMPRPELLKELS